MVKYPTKIKRQIQTFYEISFGYCIIVTNVPKKGRKLSLVKAICLSFFH